jgi:GntR family transcriptional repressor for pyruvate dehydrogenase complex
MCPPPAYPNRRRVLDASEQVAQELQRLIQSRQLVAGDRIGTETDLAALLGVSRPTLREAIRMLSSGHLVRAAQGPGGGIFVDSSPETGMGRTLSSSIALLFENRKLPMEEMLEARRTIEVPIAGLAAGKRDEAALAIMREALDQQAQADDIEASMRETDRAFHRAIAASTGNRLLQAFIDWAYEVLQPSLTAMVDTIIDFDLLLQQHREILAAIESGDPSAAEDAMRGHLAYITSVFHSLSAKEQALGGLAERWPA